MNVRLDEVIDRALAARRIVGTVVQVAHDGQVIYRRAAGHADREAGRPMAAGTIFRLSSVTKPMVSAAALALAEQGMLDLDDPVTRFIPSFTPALADGRAPTVTLRHLMSHTAGLSYRFREPHGGPYHHADVSDGFETPGRSFADNLTRVLSVPLAFEPGRGWAYSIATDVLGEAMARATGLSLAEVVRRSVTDPLGMSDTAFWPTDEARLAAPYAGAEPVPRRMDVVDSVPYGEGAIRYAPDRHRHPASYLSGGGGMFGTADDLMRFFEALRSGGAPVLTSSSVRLLATNAIGDRDIDPTAPGWGWSLGFAVLRDPRPTRTPQAPGTWRWGGVYGHSWFVDPANRLTVVSLTNTAIAGMTGAFPEAVRDAVYGVSAAT